MARILWTLREAGGLTPDLLTKFRAKAEAAGLSPTAAIARLMRRYIERGFDDGQPETSTKATTSAEPIDQL